MGYSIRMLTILLIIGLSGVYGQSGVLRVDPDNALGATVSEIFDSVQYSPLENNQKSSFGRVAKLIVSDSFFYILDHSTDAILIFHKDGRFYNKIDLVKWVKTSNRKYLGIKDFMVNKKTGNIIVSNWTFQNNLYLFNPEGKLLQVFDHNNWNELIDLDGEHYLVEAEDDILDQSKRINGSLIVTDMTFNQQKGFLPKLKKAMRISAGEALTSVNGFPVAYFTRPFDYKVYLINKNGIQDILPFVFPLKNSLPDHFLDTVASTDQLNYLKNHSSLIWNIADFYPSGNYFSFRLFHHGNNIPLLFDKRKKLTYNLLKIYPDSSNGFLPIVGGQYQYILAADSNSYYSSVPSYSLFQAYEVNKNKGINFSSVLNSYFEHQDSRSNPVLVRLIPKKNK